MPWDEVMAKFNKGELHSGSPNGPIVKRKDKALAIMLSEKRRAQQGDKEYQSTGHRLLDAVRNRRKAS